VSCDRGFFPESWLPTWAAFDSPLGFHPDRNLVPGVEISMSVHRSAPHRRRR
jgi:transketolase